jgi:predicted alpha/beta superfamily hydrolase
MARASDQKVAWEKLYGLGDVEYVHMQTRKDGGKNQSYHIFIRQPDNVDTTGKTKYPTLYLLDGGTNFPLLSSYYQFIRLMEEVPPMIIVGISYGTQD